MLINNCWIDRNKLHHLFNSSCSISCRKLSIYKKLLILSCMTKTRKV